MKKLITILFVFVFLSFSVAAVNSYSTVFNPFTNKLDYIYDLNANLTMGNNLQVNGTLTVLGDVLVTGDINATNLTVVNTNIFNVTGNFTPGLNSTFYNGLPSRLWLFTYTHNLIIGNPPAECSSGYYMSQFFGDSSTCVAAMKIDGDERLVGNYNFQGNVTINGTGNFLKTFSPNGTAWNCGVNNSGLWSCS